MVRKFLIKYHTDAEITAFLQKNAQEGYCLTGVKGNDFNFEKRTFDGRRLCALTLYRTGSEFSTELQIREKLTEIRKNGWDCICIGKPENLKDSRRHVYLIEEKNGSFLPVSDERSEKRPQIRGKFKSISNLLLCALYVSALVFLFSTSLIKVVTNNLYIVFAAVFTLLLTVCGVLCLAAFINCFFIGKKNRILDISTQITAYALILFALFLAADSFLHDRGKSERIKIGTSVYHLYSDDIPVRLENLGADTSGKYRTSRYISSESFVAGEIYCFDESFGVQEGSTVYDNSQKTGVSFISYTVFTSKSAFLRDTVASQVIPHSSVRRPDMEKSLGADLVFESQTGAYSVCCGNSILIIKSGFALTADSLRLFVETLF